MSRNLSGIELCRKSRLCHLDPENPTINEVWIKKRLECSSSGLYHLLSDLLVTLRSVQVKSLMYHFYLIIDCSSPYPTLWLGGSYSILLMMGSSDHMDNKFLMPECLVYNRT